MESPFEKNCSQAVSSEDAVEKTACSSTHKKQNAMNGETLQHRVLITNPHGFHMRPASAFVELARQFQSSVCVSKEERRVDGKSGPLELLFLGAQQGTELLLEISGPDAAEALKALIELLADSSWDEEPEPPLPSKG